MSTELKNKDLDSNDAKPVLGEVYHCYYQYGDIKCWYGTHRNANHIFEANTFVNYKPNAYKLTKEEALKVCEERDCKMELAE